MKEVEGMWKEAIVILLEADVLSWQLPGVSKITTANLVQVFLQ